MAIRKLPSGRYQIDFRDVNRVRQRETYDTRKEAQAKLDERRTAVRNREYVAPAKIPAVKVAAEAWLEGKKVARSRHGGPVKESSLDYWRNHIDKFIVPTLGAYRMDVVTSELIEKQREAWQRLGLTARTVNKVLTTLSAIFDKQLAVRTVRFNPVKYAERMATGSNEVGANGELDVDALEVRPEEVYGPDAIGRILDRAEPGFEHTILLTAGTTGARHGELLGGMWPDVDFEKREIIVRRNWSGIYRDEQPIFTTPKTRHSLRRIPIPDELCLALKKWKLQCPPSKWNLIFPKPDGRPQDRKATWRALDKAVKGVNKNVPESDKLRRLTVHSLRHSFASIHLMNGTPITEVSALLGHANVNITMQVYAHFIPKMRTDSTARFAAALFAKPETEREADATKAGEAK